MTRRFNAIGLKAGAVILVLGMATAYASAQNTSGDATSFRGRGPGGFAAGGPMGIFGPLAMIASRLSLTDAQKDQIKALAQSHADEWKALVAREQVARKAEQVAIDAAQFDEITIRQKSADLAAVQADVAVAQARARGEFLGVLTADQVTTLKTLEAKGPRGGRRGPPPAQPQQ